MATRAPGWVPAGAWLAPGYAEWQAPAPLRSAVACLWTSVVPNEAGAAGLILPDPEVARAAALLRDPATRTEDVADDVGLSVRQLRRRCHAAAGYGPKTLQRVLRFQRFVRMLDAAAPPPADMASATRADPAGPLPGPGGPLPGPAGPLPGPAGILPGPGGPLPGPLDLAWAAALAG